MLKPPTIVTAALCLQAFLSLCAAEADKPPRREPWEATLKPASEPTATPQDAIYVDPQIPPETANDYDPQTRSCGSGSKMAFKTLRGAATAAGPGQTVLLRAGKHGETLVPQKSGLPGRPITYRNYPNEEAVITGARLTPAIDISKRSYLVIEGLHISQVNMWMHAVRSSHNVIRNNRFSQALCPSKSAKTGIFFQEASFNQVTGNLIEDCSADSLALVRSDRNLIENNTFKKAGHTLWAIKGGNFNILRGNYFHNEWQKIGEVYDCENVGFDHEFNMVNCTKHNLIEGNVFAYTPSSGNHSPFAGIQYAGQNGIIRRNVFYETMGPGLDMTLYPDEAKYNTDNRVYNNVFYKTEFAGICLAGAGRFTFSGNVLKNNILAQSVFVAHDTRWPWYTRELAGKPVQLFVGRLGGFVFENNNVFHAKSDGLYLVTCGQRDSSNNGPPEKLSRWQEKHPEQFKANREVDPCFVDADKHDFHLRPASPMIDAGTFLTAAVGSGSGTELLVQDAGYFCDGFGIPGQQGDLVQLEGQAQAARVVRVDYEKKVLALDRVLTWKDGLPLATSYSGKRPDLGTFEFAP
jgi:parallel beta-helix repeat protein